MCFSYDFVSQDKNNIKLLKTCWINFEYNRRYTRQYGHFVYGISKYGILLGDDTIHDSIH